MKQLLPERIVLEVSMIKLSSRDSIASIEELISRLPEVPNLPQQKPPSTSLRPDAGPVKGITEESQKGLKQVKEAENSEKETSHDEPAALDMIKIKDAWPILVKAMAVKKMSISSYLAEGDPDSIKKNTVFVTFPREFNFHREVLEESHNKSSIESALSQILDSPVKLQFVITDRKSKEPDLEPPPPGREELKKKEPIIDTTLNIFGGKILRTKNT
jgi:flagellar motor switch/type III secretory pathway protein FliN